MTQFFKIWNSIDNLKLFSPFTFSLTTYRYLPHCISFIDLYVCLFYYIINFDDNDKELSFTISHKPNCD